MKGKTRGGRGSERELEERKERERERRERGERERVRGDECQR